jgi:probable rRNA maturation factor
LACPDETELSVTIVGDRVIHRLNRDYLGKDRPTNVISFSQQEGEFPDLTPHVLGDVVISADTATKEAAAGAWNGYERLIFLLLHGILHLTGYDHERNGEAEARRMERKEQEIWSMLQQEGLTTLP